MPEHIESAVKQDDELAKNEFKAVINTRDKDRHGTRIDPDGLDVEAFRKNPVFLLFFNALSVYRTPLLKCILLHLKCHTLYSQLRVQTD